MNIFNRSLFEMMGRLASCAFFGIGLFTFGWEGSIVLFGFWLEEVFAFIFIAIKRRVVIARMNTSPHTLKKDEKFKAVSPLLYVLFPVVHLLFVLVFIGIDSMKNEASENLLSTLWGIVSFNTYYIDSGSVKNILMLVACFIVLGIVDAGKNLTFGSDGRRATLRSLDAQNRAALVMPHISIILGGFALLMFQVTNWMGAGLLAGKCVCELLLLPGAKKEEQNYEEVEKGMPRI